MLMRTFRTWDPSTCEDGNPMEMRGFPLVLVSGGAVKNEEISTSSCFKRNYITITWTDLSLMIGLGVLGSLCSSYTKNKTYCGK